MKHIKFTLVILLLSCALFFSATAGTGQTDSLPLNSGIILLLAIGLGVGVKLISRKLKQVDRDLQDAFGEKVL